VFVLASTEEAVMTAETHVVLDGRYALDEPIGHGGMADVYRGTDQVLLRPVAVKVLRETTDETLRDRFISEARTLASLNHPGLITLLDAGILADRPYLVMELVSGPTLSACIAEGSLDPERVRIIGQQLAEALGYAHAQGIIHRDVKPSNVLVCEDDRVLLADFGIARLIGDVQHETKTGEAIGSPPYLAPEQVAGGGLGPSADVFSLGLVLLEALTFERAYTGTPIEAAIARLHTPPTIPGDLDPRWRELIARMTDREPANRPTAVRVAEELASESFSTPPLVRHSQAEDTGSLEATGPMDMSAEDLDAPAPGQAEPGGRRRRLWAAAAAVVVVVAVAVGVLVATPPDRAQSTDPDPVLPSGVPTRMQDPLEDLHRAVDGHQP
jgi:eukaryotic-like serine/threonine-protein kinase